MEFTKEEQIQAIYDLKVGYTLVHADIAMLKAMARQLLASMEQEPVAYMHHSGQVVTREECCDDKIFAICCKVETPLYAAPQLPQPAPERKAITQHFDTIALDTAKMVMCDVNRRQEFLGGDIQLLSRIQCRIDEACRAAMLQGAEPVRQPDELPMDYLHGHKDGLEWAARLAEANHPQTGDWLYDDPLELAKAIRKGPDMPVEPMQKLTFREALAAIRNLGPIDAEKIQAERDALNEPTCWCLTCRPVTMTDMRFVVCPDCGNKRCPHANDHRNACTGSNEPGQEGSAYPAAPQQEVK